MNLFPIEYKLPKAAFDLFRLWTSQFSDQEQISIKNEQVLIADLRQAFHDALRALFARKDRHEKPEGWQTGFVLGFVESYLSSGWYQDYIVRKSRTFKILTGIQAIESYLKFDEDVKLRINRIYEHLLFAPFKILDTFSLHYRGFLLVGDMTITAKRGFREGA